MRKTHYDENITFLRFIESSLTNQYEAILGLWNFQFSYKGE